MSATSIQWCDRTINPLRARNLETGAVGHFCEKVSPGCTNCYASDWNERVRPQASGKLIGTGLAFDARNRDKVEFFLDETKLEEVLRRRKPAHWFWCDMTDIFGAWVPDEHLDRIFATMLLTPQHTHLVLTKRAERMRDYASDTSIHGLGFQPDVCTRLATVLETFGKDIAPVDIRKRWPLPNVRLGVSVEDVPRAERFAAVCELGERGWNTMVSMEPLLDDVEIPARYLALGSRAWVIPGGESHKTKAKARVCNLAWIRRPVQQCFLSNVAVFVKQLGSNPIVDSFNANAREELRAFGGRTDFTESLSLKHRKGGDPSEWADDLRVRQFPESRALAETV